LFKGEEREEHAELYFVFNSCRALRKGDWKVVSFYGHRWELYNIAEDRCEQHDLAGQYPEKVNELSGIWHRMAEYTDMLPEKRRGPVKDLPAPNTHQEWHKPERTVDWKAF